MTQKTWLRATCAPLAILAMLQSTLAFAAEPITSGKPTSAAVAAHVYNLTAEPALSQAAKLALLRQKVKYVFVLFQENRSFDQHFGTFPGVDGLFSKPAAQTPGFAQPIVNTDGTTGTISPFLITQSVKATTGATVPLYPADTDSVDHSHAGIDNSLDVDANNAARNDRYALNAEGLTTVGGKIVSSATLLPATSSPTLAQKQKAELTMSHLDCDTIPFLWQFADRFVLFDNFHQTIIGPSTPNAIAMIAGQSGQTQWALHPSTGNNNTGSPVVSISGGEPVTADPGPFAGSNNDTSKIRPPYSPDDSSPKTPALNQTYATLPLSFMGKNIAAITAADQNPAIDLPDVQHDIASIATKAGREIGWGWYQEGYTSEPTDTGVTTHATYITHHNGPQYFGYIADNTKERTKLRGLRDFYLDVWHNKLPADGGVFYVRGGYGNNDGLKPVDQNPTVQANFTGSDDHPGYTDAQISEALVADEVNAIATSPYWKDSAIVITYDETDGLYDHGPVHVKQLDPQGRPLSGGPRIPAIVISPYGRAHVISHEYAEHSSVIKFINELFDLTPLAKLPDEARGRALGKSELGQPNLGPNDADADVGDLLTAFDNGRLLGTVPLLDKDYAVIKPAAILSLPHYGGNGCYALNIVPTDYVNGQLIDPPPADFNPRPNSTPGLPTSGAWTP